MNWGKGIAIFLGCYMITMGSMAYFTFTKNADLVSEDYYENELNFDQTKGEKANYIALNAEIRVAKSEEGVVFQFPAELEKLKSGSIEFYRPDQKIYDRTFELELAAGNTQALEYSNFVDGYYDISIRWEDTNDKAYIYESNILF